MITISSPSTELVQFRVDIKIDGRVYNPTGDAAAIAFTPEETKPAAGDWHPATWDTTPPNTYRAQILVGPSGGVTPGVGLWDAWVKITDNPEIPVRKAGQLRIE